MDKYSTSLAANLLGVYIRTYGNLSKEKGVHASLALLHILLVATAKPPVVLWEFMAYRTMNLLLTTTSETHRFILIERFPVTNGAHI